MRIPGNRLGVDTAQPEHRRRCVACLTNIDGKTTMEFCIESEHSEEMVGDLVYHGSFRTAGKPAHERSIQSSDRMPTFHEESRLIHPFEVHFEFCNDAVHDTIPLQGPKFLTRGRDDRSGREPT